MVAAGQVAGRHLGPYLARTAGVARPDRLPELSDVEALEGEALAETEADHMEALGLALTAADADARWRDYRGALRWLDVAEQISLTLPPEYERASAKHGSAAANPAPRRRSGSNANRRLESVATTDATASPGERMPRIAEPTPSAG